MKLENKKLVSFFYIFILAFGFISFVSLIPNVNAETRQLSSGEPIEVQPQNDGTFTDSSGKVYTQDQNGRLNPKLDVISQSNNLNPSLASSTNVPTNAPTGSISPQSLQGTSQPNPTTNRGSAGVGNQLASNAGLLSGSGFGDILKGPIAQSLIWGGVAYLGGQMVGGFLGGDSEFTDSLSVAAGIGAFSGKIAQGFFETDTLTSIGIGAGVGLVTFYLLYEEEKYEEVVFQCMPWQAPLSVSEDACEQCNDEDFPCSEYRCRSLGQTCELVNKGTNEERCVNVNPKDVTPPIIRPNNEELTVGYEYQNVRLSPPGPGFSIIRTGSDNCVEAFTPLRFGVETDEPSQCKIDFNSTTDYDSMYAYMGGSNLFKYEHYEQLILPHASDFGNSSFTLANGKDLTFFIRCTDRNGNYNEAEYAVNFCVDPSPDTTAPRIKLTSVDDNSCIPANTDSGEVEFYVNEPSQCRWSREDQSYDLMINEMDCDTKLFQMNALQLYTCKANLTGITKELTDFYVRCQDGQNKDVNDRNTNQESYKFSLRGSNQLKLRNLVPNNTVYGGVNPMPVQLEVETLFGCEDSRASCFFSDEEDGDYILFADTDRADGLHKQTLYLNDGSYDYYVKCVDSGGNLVEDSTSFDVDIDTASPIIARIYNDLGQLKIVTLRDSECTYTNENCDFLFEEGIRMPKDNSKIHFAEWLQDETYYIKCRDEFRDLTADCSAIVKPSKIFFE